MSDDRGLIAALMADAILAGGAPTPPWSLDYGRCVCGAWRGEPCTDHSEIVCYAFAGDELLSIASGGPNGKVLWRKEDLPSDHAADG